MPGMTVHSESNLPGTHAEPVVGGSQSESGFELPSNTKCDTDSESDFETESEKDYSLEEAEQSNVKHGQGASRFLKAWGTTTKMNLVANEHNEIIGDNAAKFSTQLGAIARDGNKLPLTYIDWRALPQTKKDRVWMDIKANTNLDDSFKSYILKRQNKHRTEWKQTIKKKYYLPFTKDKEMLATCSDPRIEEKQWHILVNY